MGASFTYTTPPPWTMLPYVAALFGVVGLAILISSVLGDGPPLVFGLIWIATMSFAFGDAFFRTSYRLTVHDDLIEWRGWFGRSGAAPLTDLVKTETQRLGSVQVFQLKNGHRIRIPVMQGFAAFRQQLSIAYPELELSDGRYEKLIERASRPQGETTPSDDRSES